MKLSKSIKLEKILETDNLVELISEEDQKKIVNEVVQGYETDCTTRDEWLTATKKYMKIANCDVTDRSVPWPGASNVCLPTIANSCVAGASRLYAELLRNKYPAEAFIMGQNDIGELDEVAKAIKEHLLYQLKVDDKSNWEEDLYTLCYLFYVTGTVARYKYYDETNRCFKFKTLWPDQWCISQEADDINYSRFSFCEKMLIVEILERISTGEYSNYKYIEDLDVEATDIYEHRDIIKQFVRIDMDGDEYAEPYCVLVDYDSNEMIQMTKNFHIESTLETDETGAATYSSPQIEYKDNGEIKKVIKLDPIPYVTIYRMNENLDGSFYKYGIAHILYPINRAQNVLINQILDIGTLQARQGAFIDQRARLPGGTRSLALNQSMFVKPPPGVSLRDTIMPFPRSEISPVQYQMLEFLKMAGDEAGNLTEIMNGQVPDNTSPMIGMAAIQNSLLPFKASYRLFLTSYSKEFKSIAEMNYIYLDDEEYAELNSKQIKITREMYNPDITRVVPIVDPVISSDAERYYQQAVLDSIIDRPETDDRAILLRKLNVSNIDAPEAYLPEPDKNPPPSPEIIQMQATMKMMEEANKQQWEEIKLKQQQLELKSQESEHKINKERLETSLKADKELSEQQLRNALAVKHVSTAEAAEKGTQIDQYIAVTDRLGGPTDEPRRIEPGPGTGTE